MEVDKRAGLPSFVCFLDIGGKGALMRQRILPAKRASGSSSVRAFCSSAVRGSGIREEMRGIMVKKGAPPKECRECEAEQLFSLSRDKSGCRSPASFHDSA